MRRWFKAILLVFLAGQVLQAQGQGHGKKSYIRVLAPVGAGHRIYVRGNGGGLGWGESGARVAHEVAPGVWELELDLEHPIELKTLLDNRFWLEAGESRYELNSNGNVVLRPGETRTLLEPNFKTETQGHIEERRVGQTTLRVYTPPGYRRGAGIRYPVLYLFDGDKLFGTGKQSWQAHLTMDQLILQGRMPPAVIVGINPGDSNARMDLLTPFPGVDVESRDFRIIGGKLFDFARHIVTDVKTLIDSSYDVFKDRIHTSIGGSSLGGLAAVTTAVSYPETFGNGIGMSGSWFWGEVNRDAHGRPIIRPGIDPKKDVIVELQYSAAQWIGEQVERIRTKGKPVPRLLISAGEAEFPVMPRSMDVLAARLQAAGYRVGDNLFLYKDPQGHHGEDSWQWQFRVQLSTLGKQVCKDDLTPLK